MKQKDLIKKLEEEGFVFEGHGGNHDIYRRGIDKCTKYKEKYRVGCSVFSASNEPNV